MTQIDYAPSLVWHRRAKVRRWLLALVALAFVVGLARWGGPLWSKADLLLAQRACLDYSADPTLVCYDDGPGRAQYLRPGGEYVGMRGYDSSQPTVATRVAAGLMPKCWRRYAPMAGGSASGAMIYLGRRRSSGGDEFIVSVQYVSPGSDTFTPAFIEGFNLETLAVTPGSLTRAPKANQFPIAVDVLSGRPVLPPNLRIFAGQPDPADDSKFTIDYEMWGQRDTLDGQVADDGRVALTPRRVPEPASEQRPTVVIPAAGIMPPG